MNDAYDYYPGLVYDLKDINARLTNGFREPVAPITHLTQVNPAMTLPVTVTPGQQAILDQYDALTAKRRRLTIADKVRLNERYGKLACTAPDVCRCVNCERSRGLPALPYILTLPRL